MGSIGEPPERNDVHVNGNDSANGHGNGTFRDERSNDWDPSDAAQKCIDTSLHRYPETGITVLCVGAGLGGLVTALECWRKGHSPRIIERSKEPVLTGDVLTMQPSSMSFLRHWPMLAKEIEREQYDCAMSYKRHTGEHIYGPSPPQFNDPEARVGRKGPSVATMQSRIRFYESFTRQAERCGIPIEWGHRVVEYWEDDFAGVGGVILDDGSKRAADVVVAADGLKTKSGRIVSGMDTAPEPSGTAIYRAGYPVEHALNDPVVKERWQWQKGDKPIWEFWLGAGFHVMVSLTDDWAFWGLTHTDDGTASESWDPNVDPEDVVRTMEHEVVGWHPAVSAFMKTAPRGSIVHWKLMWRDLHEEWTSPGGRVVQVGDSAHSFLPASGNGATQALEDAITLATCLQLGGRKSVAAATKAHNKLRYQRVSCAQKMSFVNTQIKHKTDWDMIAKNPKMVRSRYPRWVWGHDPEAYAYEKFGEALDHVLSGGQVELRNTNIPPGHKFKKWTIREVQEQIKNGYSLAEMLDGDWS